MAKYKGGGVWGVDIGQCALKALRCSLGSDGRTIIADAFDYIEYPKILSQPDAEPEALVSEALEQFLSRNETKGDKIAMSVSGQAGLSRFFKPPPVDAKVIPDIVKYEARQQIPFALDDVIWDYQRIGGAEVDGFVMDAEVGIFAMKRDAVFRALKPFLQHDVEVEIVQLAPLSVFNVVCYDVLKGGPDPEEVDLQNPPESLVILSMGTETTDLVITNGLRLWQRNIPLGGNHFTKQLTKELKLTYAKAEHLKRNARQAEDPKTVFQVMRPVFNDLVTEIQRSIGYFQSIDRQAKIGKMVMLGNAVKLPGLRQYLSKNLGHDVLKLDSFKFLSGSAVTDSKAFKDNLLAFSVCFGLCLQGLGISKLVTNLLPREFIFERLIRDKKPWAVAAVGALLLAVTFNFYFHYSAWSQAHQSRSHRVRNMPAVTWSEAKQRVDEVERVSNEMLQRDAEQMTQFRHIESLGEEVVGDGDRKLLWLELLKAINDALPRRSPSENIPPGAILDPKHYPFDKRPELQVEYLESQYFPDLQAWYLAGAQHRYEEELRRVDSGTAIDGSNVAAAADTDVPADTGPAGPGWVIELGGYHYHNGEEAEKNINAGGAYVRNTLLRKLREGSTLLPGEGGQETEFTYKELGIGYPILCNDPPVDRLHVVLNPNHPANARGAAQEGRAPVGNVPVDDLTEPREYPAPKYEFVVQFCWQEKRLTQRLLERAAEQALTAPLGTEPPPAEAAPAAGVAEPPPADTTEAG